jgi:DNA-binding transcriptional ArsR family regulator
MTHETCDIFHYLWGQGRAKMPVPPYMRVFEYTTMDSTTLAQEFSQLEANLCSAFADPTRILILYALDERPRNVTDLANELGLTQPTASRHLKILRDHGLVHTRRQGSSVTYELLDRRLIDALQILREVLRDTIALKASLVSELEAQV